MLTFETQLAHDNLSGDWPICINGIHEAHVGSLNDSETYWTRQE